LFEVMVCRKKLQTPKCKKEVPQEGRKKEGLKEHRERFFSWVLVNPFIYGEGVSYC